MPKQMIRSIQWDIVWQEKGMISDTCNNMHENQMHMLNKRNQTQKAT